jgi:aspartyl aminopeptidase
MTKTAWKNYDEAQLSELSVLSKEYIDFISNNKTERECVRSMVAILKENGYKSLDEITEVKSGDKVYAVHMGKTLVIYNVGSEPIENGMNILGAHIDSPRLDVKQKPLYESSELTYFDTHYYGGIKKYQWVTIPLAIHGVVIKKNGECVEINIGEKDSDPVFFVSDLLVHLSQEQLEKKAAKVIDGEALDVVIGSIPLTDSEEDAVKANVLKLLSDTYNITEDDFLSAELEVVPAGKAREAGFDRGLILGYGHDDRSCAFTSFKAMLESGELKRTACCILADKEEIGSVGATGMHSRFFEDSLAELMDLMGEFSELKLRRAMRNSLMLSSDVSSAYDSLYSEVFDSKNTAYLGRGVVFNKFTGSRGKSGSNDANPEFIAQIRDILDSNKIAFQTAELGKVDRGGGGTIAYILANYGMNVIDCGVPVMNMHAPWEAISKADIYEAERCYIAFINEAKSR